MLTYALGLFAIVALPVAIYGLHRSLLHLERRGYIYYWHQQPQSGSGYAPFHEMVQPQIRHVIEVSEQEASRADDESGSQPDLAGREP